MKDNPCSENNYSNEDKLFSEKWVPIIRKLRTEKKNGLMPSMNECLNIIKKTILM